MPGPPPVHTYILCVVLGSKLCCVIVNPKARLFVVMGIFEHDLRFGDGLCITTGLGLPQLFLRLGFAFKARASKDHHRIVNAALLLRQIGLE